MEGWGTMGPWKPRIKFVKITRSSVHLVAYVIIGQHKNAHTSYISNIPFYVKTIRQALQFYSTNTAAYNLPVGVHSVKCLNH